MTDFRVLYVSMQANFTEINLTRSENLTICVFGETCLATQMNHKAQLTSLNQFAEPYTPIPKNLKSNLKATFSEM